MQILDIAGDNKDKSCAHMLLGVVSERLEPQTWADFKQYCQANPDEKNPLDRWGRERVLSLIEGFDIAAYFPDDQPHFPLVSNALECFASLHRSPLGMLVSTRYGLMFGIRSWLSGPKYQIDKLARCLGWKGHVTLANPCTDCISKPCLSACPVGAFTPQGYDYPVCVDELKSQYKNNRQRSGECWLGGCLARTACPWSTSYSPEQASFYHSVVIGLQGKTPHEYTE